MSNPQEPNYEGLLKELRSKVDTWIAANPQTRNLAVLARKISFTDSTIRRMLSGECKLNFEASSLILQEVCPRRKEMHEILGKYYPQVASVFTLKDYENDLLENNNGKDLNSLEDFLSDSINYKVWVIAASESYTLEDIKTDLGRQGIQAYYKMVEAGFLGLSSAGTVSIASQYQEINYTLSLSRVFYEKSAEIAAHAEHQMSSNQIRWLKMDTFKEAARLSAKYHDDMTKLTTNPSAKGQIPVAINQLITRLDVKEVEKISKDKGYEI